MKSIAALLANYEGRDKLNKLVQYQGRMWMQLLLKSNPEGSAKAKILFINFRLARKIFRLLKSIQEYQKFMDILDKPPSNCDEINLVLSRYTLT